MRTKLLKKRLKTFSGTIKKGNRFLKLKSKKIKTYLKI